MDDSSTFLNKRDYRKTPFKTGVALGESTTAGGTATRRELTWVHRLGQLIDEAQLEPIRLINSGLGANLISPRSPAYESSGKPSAMERYERHVLAHRPDLVLVSYGLNDARGGPPLEAFLQDLGHILLDIRERSGALMVLINAYFMTAFDQYPPFDRGSLESFMGFNAAMRHLALECDVLYADVFEAQGMAPWMVDPDGVHANNLGHRVIANRVFEVLARNCSALAQSAVESRKTFEPWRDESVLRRR